MLYGDAWKTWDEILRIIDRGDPTGDLDYLQKQFGTVVIHGPAYDRGRIQYSKLKRC